MIYLGYIEFELLVNNEIDKIVCIGPQAYDIATRLKYANIDEDKIVVIPNVDEAARFIKTKTKGNVYGILNFDMVSCGFTIVTGDKEKVQDTFEEEYVDFYDNKEMIYAYFDKKYLNGSACAMLVKKELYSKIDMCEGAVPGEEICTTLQLYQIAKSVRTLSAPLYYYWQNEEGISHGGYTPRHRKGLMNYISLCDSMVDRFPEIRVKIGAYFCEYEMAVMTAMCRNDVYDIEVINMLQNHLKKYFSELMRNGSTALYYKVSAALIIVNYRWFAVIFKRIRKSVGR